MPAEPAPALALFDIDGTLIRRAGPHHREALVEAVRRATGIETTTDGIPVYGMLDPDIIRLMLLQAGATQRAIRAAMPSIVQEAQSIYVRICPALERKTCPGVRRLLARIERSGIPMALVTGNLVDIGWKKMERAGLKRYFRFGAFAGMARDRPGLARIAICHARAEKWIRRGAPVSLIGDAPADILAARANGARSIAVATGLVARESLAAYDPDVLLDDLRDLDPAILL
jgi:phosphoglycolate phosphatase